MLCGAQIDWPTVPPSAWAAVLWAGIVGTAGAHSSIAWAISRCSAVLPSTYGTMQPVLTGVLAAIVLGQVCTLRCTLVFVYYWAAHEHAAVLSSFNFM